MSGRRLLALFIFVTMESEVLLDASAQLPNKKVLLIKEENVMAHSPTYSLEDFFWTGSGDGPLPPTDKSHRPTIVRTTTVLATVFLDSPSSMTPNTPSEEDCVSDCPINPFTGEIDPTRVGEGSDEDSSNGGSLPDPKYWLLTVLRAPAAPLPPSLSRSLAKLYQKAFVRQQQQHLGIITTSSVSQRKKHHTDSNYAFANHSIQTESILYNENQLNVSGILNEDSEIFNTSNVNKINISSRGDVNLNDENIYNKLFTNGNTNHTVNNLTNDTINVKVKRSIKSIAEELNIIFMRNFSRENSTSYNKALDLVKREIYSEIGQPLVEVFLYNLTRENKSGEDDEVKVVYWVSVGGRPVPARTAARDMKLLADSEVVAELGYPITTKAEPYLQPTEPANGVIQANSMRDYYLIIAASVLAVIILLSLVAILACRLANRRKSSGVSRVIPPIIATNGEKQVHYPVSIQGKDNKGYLEEEKDKKFISIIYPDKNKSKDQMVQYGSQRLGSAGSTSSSLSASDLSQMTATLHQRQRMFEKHMKSEYATVNKRNKSKNRRMRSKKVGVIHEQTDGQTLDDVGDQSIVSSPSSSSVSSCDSVIMRRPQGVVSPTSYLSMPSVKSFPRGNAVEPLSRVLEPLSVKHLDMDSDSPVHIGKNSNSRQKGDNSKIKKCSNDYTRVQNLDVTNLVRMGSMNKDPGVIGPIVWDLHRQKLENESNMSDEADSVIGGNITKMRQRFSELVDDAFSLFGSGGSTPKTVEKDSQAKLTNIHSNAAKIKESLTSPDQRRHSSKDRVEFSRQPEKPEDRPHTALPPRPPLPQYNINPTLAWGSNSNTPMLRASSAGGIRRPTIDVTLINSDSANPPTDPTIPLIQAIKKELDKLPGTSDA